MFGSGARRAAWAAAVLALLLAAPARADHNDAFGLAFPMQIGDSYTETTVGFSTEAGEWLSDRVDDSFCMGAATWVDTDATAWHEIVGNGRRLTVTAHSPQHGVLVAVYRSTDLSALSGALIGCNYDQAFQRQTVSFSWDSQAGVPYRVQIGRCREFTASGALATVNRCGTDPGTLHVGVTAGAAANDDAGAPAPLGAGGEFDNVGAGAVPGEATSCGPAAYGKTVWFSWQAPAKGDVAFEATSRTAGLQPMVMSIHDGATVVGCGQGTAAAPVRAGVTYRVQVGGPGAGAAAQEGRFFLRALFAQDFDVDDDRVPAPPVGSDCDDNDPRRFPGNRDVPENGLDEDCKGGDARFAVLRASPRMAFVAARGGVRIRELQLRSVQRGVRVVLRCRRGPGCRRGSRVVVRRARRPSRSLRISTRGYGVLRRGTTIEVDVTKPGAVGRRFRWGPKLRGPAPRFAEFCLHPKRRAPYRC